MALTPAQEAYYKGLIESDPTYAAIKARLEHQRQDLLASGDAQSAGLADQYARDYSGGMNTANAHGVLFSGATVNAANQARDRDAQNRAALSRMLTQGTHQINDDLLGAGTDATQRLIAAGVVPPADDATPGGGGGPGGVPGGPAPLPTFRPNPGVGEDYQPYGVGRPPANLGGGAAFPGGLRPNPGVTEPTQPARKKPAAPRLPAPPRGLRPAGGF